MSVSPWAEAVALGPGTGWLFDDMTTEAFMRAVRDATR